ncbi:hypothetical protein GCM10009557_63720 [Virgisporangium ochraceum]|uniref:Uncharacterized protein n=1 Tax=Virgisporangium ochraceum TaxID=65505 RepID=A0A8J3ZT89_9ACTN|nr:hypothetical protein [Virgisporangium ochraceum]GIJ68643.1 hypothetical protein Voc01_035600 [Virgisporangium ochraceum]
MPDFEDLLRQVMAIRGTLRAALIDHSSGMTVAALGRGDDGEDADRQQPRWEPDGDTGPMDIIRATVSSPTFVAPATPGYVEDIVITSANGYHLIHFVVTAFDARLVLYVWLDRLVGNLAMTQRSLRNLGQHLVAA